MNLNEALIKIGDTEAINLYSSIDARGKVVLFATRSVSGGIQGSHLAYMIKRGDNDLAFPIEFYGNVDYITDMQYDMLREYLADAWRILLNTRVVNLEGGDLGRSQIHYRL